MPTNIIYVVLTNLSTHASTNIPATSWFEQNAEMAKSWGPVVVGSIGLLIGLLGMFIQVRLMSRQSRQFETQMEHARHQLTTSQKQAEEQNNFAKERFQKEFDLARSKEKREEVAKQLNSFYGPFKELRTESRLLYEKFALRLQQEHRDQGKHFRTLRYLIETKADQNNLSEQDKELLGRILSIDRRLLELTETSLGLVDRPELHDLLGKLAAHARVLQLASERKLSGPPDVFDNLVFPLAIDGAIESAILRLEQQHAELGGLGRSPSVIRPSAKVDAKTIEYYNKNADKYAQNTTRLDNQFYWRFRDHLCRSFLLSPADVSGVENLIKQIRSSEEPVWRWVWSAFSNDGRKELEANLKLKRAEAILVSELNALIRGKLIYDQEAFRDVRLSAEAQALLDKQARGEGVRRLNRMLLEDAFCEDRNDKEKGYLRRQDVAKAFRLGGRILDAGCGAGRDTRYFIENGYMVVSFDASEEMVAKCNEYPHAYCKLLAFSQVEYREEFDGVWACGSLVHLNPEDAKEAITRLKRALKPGGVLFVCVKEGSPGGHADSKGRFFYYYNSQNIFELFEHEEELSLVERWKSDLQVPEPNGGTYWINLTLKRRERN
jgi:SAM-dependent methyltransferase